MDRKALVPIRMCLDESVLSNVQGKYDERVFKRSKKSVVRYSSNALSAFHALSASDREPSRTPLDFTHLDGNGVLAIRVALISITFTNLGALIDETVEASPSGSKFIEVGYLHDAHGLKGEISIKHTTDFPEMRFSKGKRWLRRKISGREDVQEVELVSGRIHSKHKSWIVKFDGIDDVDQAKQLIGATLLVQEHDRPMLEEGEFYSADLIGMQVILKETGKPVGTVVDVHNYGASDLLRVLLDSSLESATPKSEIAESDPVVWIPFVEAIVPDVDISKKEMHITPPKGLLELNLRSSQSSKKEKRARDLSAVLNVQLLHNFATVFITVVTNPSIPHRISM
ncbi:Ribosome maturation factor RimM-like protein [Drosera capensis]